MMVSGPLLLNLHLIFKSPKESPGMHSDFDPDPDLFQAKKDGYSHSKKKTPTPLSGLLPRLGLLAILASGHLTEPIWLGLFIVALPDLATPIAKSFGNAFWNN